MGDGIFTQVTITEKCRVKVSSYSLIYCIITFKGKGKGKVIPVLN